MSYQPNYYYFSCPPCEGPKGCTGPSGPVIARTLTNIEKLECQEWIKEALTPLWNGEIPNHYITEPSFRNYFYETINILSSNKLPEEMVHYTLLHKAWNHVVWMNWTLKNMDYFWTVNSYVRFPKTTVIHTAPFGQAYKNWLKETYFTPEEKWEIFNDLKTHYLSDDFLSHYLGLRFVYLREEPFWNNPKYLDLKTLVLTGTQTKHQLATFLKNMAKDMANESFCSDEDYDERYNEPCCSEIAIPFIQLYKEMDIKVQKPSYWDKFIAIVDPQLREGFKSLIE